MLEFLEEKSLLCPHQFKFCSSDSCKCHLISIFHDNFTSFDRSPTLEMRENLLDISKVFEKTWHEEYLLKLEHTGVS